MKGNALKGRPAMQVHTELAQRSQAIGQNALAAELINRRLTHIGEQD
jgi:hypothetical protein